jgi:hypothetical protein
MKILKSTAKDAAGRLTLIRDVFLTVFDATGSFAGDDLGSELAYLFASIAKVGDVEQVEWGEDSHEPHLALFRQLFPAEHRVWNFIDIPDFTGVPNGGP